MCCKRIFDRLWLKAFHKKSSEKTQKKNDKTTQAHTVKFHRGFER